MRFALPFFTSHAPCFGEPIFLYSHVSTMHYPSSHLSVSPVRNVDVLLLCVGAVAPRPARKQSLLWARLSPSLAAAIEPDFVFLADNLYNDFLAFLRKNDKTIGCTYKQGTKRGHHDSKRLYAPSGCVFRSHCTPILPPPRSVVGTPEPSYARSRNNGESNTEL